MGPLDVRSALLVISLALILLLLRYAIYVISDTKYHVKERVHPVFHSPRKAFSAYVQGTRGQL